MASKHNLSDFQFTRILKEDPRSKTINILGTLPPTSDGDFPRPAVILIEKTHFSAQQLGHYTTERITHLLANGENDIYHWWFAVLKADEKDPDLKMTVICPATDAHILKYSAQPVRMLTETPEIYNDVVFPWVESQSKSKIQWIYNILEGVSERENVMLREDGVDSGFIVLPDSKWDRKTMDSLYLLAISHNRDIRSIRDLDRSHVPLLKSIRSQVLKFVPKWFPEVRADEVRLFVHYQPTYYHFHVHITHVRAEVGGNTVGQSHLLETIIDNIENIDENYYKKCTLRYALGVSHPLHDLIVNANQQQQS